MNSIWPDFGFRVSPYATTPIPATAEGEKLLVGRNTELRRLKVMLGSSVLHPTVEGENGAGKTSLVAVAGFQLFKDFRNGRTAQALVPLRKSFQLTPGDKVADVRRRVLLEAAQGMIDHFDDLKARGIDVPDVKDMRRWLTRAIQRQGSGGLSAAGFGVSAGGGATPNTSAGFSESGFETVIEGWLRQCFPSAEAGGLICVIDNLELLETSQAARTLLESMRDEVLGLPGLRWVLCGSRGIVQTAASSPRLEGRLASPMTVGPLSHNAVTEVIGTRRAAYQIRSDAVAPVGRAAFRHLYNILNRNLRNALKHAEDFSVWLALESQPPWRSDSNWQLLEVWLTETADRYRDQTRLGQAAWRVFETLAGLGGTCSPSDNEMFGYNTPMALRPQIKALEDANLVVSSIDDTDKRRKTISITPRGWLVQYARSGYRTPASN